MRSKFQKNLNTTQGTSSIANDDMFSLDKNMNIWKDRNKFQCSYRGQSDRSKVGFKPVWLNNL